MKKTIIALSIIATSTMAFAEPRFITFVKNSTYNVTSDNPEGETGTIIGGGSYVKPNEDSSGGGENGGGNALCDDPANHITRDDLLTMISNGDDVTQVCTDSITDFSYLFRYQGTFNQDISSWNVSNGETFQEMFSGASKFNQDISSWNVSKSKNFAGMFNWASDFNQDISSWNVGLGENFVSMFVNAVSFDQDISSWNVDSAPKPVLFADFTPIEGTNKVPEKFR
ncbi:DUF285 domain-containing protein [Vibrio parahaemolyticus]|nr:DUF285 domain-containing protein [Vibrio parahaemolyticus]EJR2787906.1 DUF285 domain-containing protein [Vibrio parahaemolyticus]